MRKGEQEITEFRNYQQLSRELVEISALGHSNVAVTAAIYSHSLSKDELEAGDTWERTVGETIEHDRKNTKIC